MVSAGTRACSGRSTMGASVPSTSNSTAELPGCERKGRSGSGGTGAYSSAVRPALVLLGIGLAAGFLSALFGVGGGLVVVPALVMLQRYDLRRATATSLAAIGFTAVFGAVRYGVRGDVHWLDALLVGLPAVAGVGARHVAPAQDPHPLARARLRGGGGRRLRQAPGLLMAVVEIVVLGVAGGVMSGLFGVGGGIIFVPLLTLALGLGQLAAEATSLAAIVPVVAVGAIRQDRAGLVQRRAATLIGLASLGGVIAGAAVATSLSDSTLRRAVRPLPGGRRGAVRVPGLAPRAPG